MNNVKPYHFLTGVTTTGSSDILSPNNGDSLLIVEVYGNATGLSLKFQGIVDLERKVNGVVTWEDGDTIAFVSAKGTTGTEITENGKYYFTTDGLAVFRISLDAITGGNVTVFGRGGY